MEMDASAIHFLAMIVWLFVFVMSGLCSILTSPGGGSPSREDLQLIQTLLRWPSQYSFPGMPCIFYCGCTWWIFIRFSLSAPCIIGLDLLRLALLSENGLKFFFGDADNGQVFLGELFASAVYVWWLCHRVSCLLGEVSDYFVIVIRTMYCV